MNFSTWSRIGGLLSVAGAIATPFIDLFTAAQFSWLGIYLLVVGVLMGIVELPVLCTFMNFCKKISAVLQVVTKLLIFRGLFYMGIGAGGIAIFVKEKPIWYLLLVAIVILVDGLFYLIAFFKKEPSVETDVSIPTIKSTATTASATASRWGGDEPEATPLSQSLTRPGPSSKPESADDRWNKGVDAIGGPNSL